MTANPQYTSHQIIPEALTNLLKEQEDQINELRLAVEEERKTKQIIKRAITGYDKKMKKVTQALEITGLNVSDDAPTDNNSLEIRPFTRNAEEEIRKLETEVKKLQLIVFSGKYQGTPSDGLLTIGTLLTRI
jgi:hypothetical protein